MIIKVYQDKPIYRAIFNSELLKNLSNYKHGNTHSFRLDLLLNDGETLSEIHDITKFLIGKITGADVMESVYNVCMYEDYESLILTFELVEDRGESHNSEYDVATKLMKYTGASDDYLLSAEGVVQLYKHYHSTHTYPAVYSDKLYSKIRSKQTEEHALLNINNIKGVRREEPESMMELVGKLIKPKWQQTEGYTPWAGERFKKLEYIFEFPDIEDAYLLLPIIKEDIKTASLYKSHITKQYYLKLKLTKEVNLLTKLEAPTCKNVPYDAECLTEDAYELFK